MFLGATCKEVGDRGCQHWHRTPENLPSRHQMRADGTQDIRTRNIRSFTH
jgi:hypothetical protein